ELDGRDDGLDADGREPDDHCGTTGAQTVPCEPHRLGPSDHLERVLDSAVGQLPYDGRGVGDARIDRVGRAARACEVEYRRIAIYGDDRARAGEHEARDHLLPDAAAADDCGPFADARPRDVA